MVRDPFAFGPFPEHKRPPCPFSRMLPFRADPRTPTTVDFPSFLSPVEKGGWWLQELVAGPCGFFDKSAKGCESPGRIEQGAELGLVEHLGKLGAS